MAETVLMPKLGFDMAEGTLVRWVKKEGDQVKKGDILAEIETDKATVEVESSFTGEVLKTMVDQGTSVPVGQAIAVIGEHGEKVDGAPGKDQEPAGASVKEVQPAPAQDVEEGEERPERGKKEAEQPAVKSVAESRGEEVKTAEPAGQAEGGMVKASPLARRIAAERSIDLSTVRGSGPDGRIVRKDVESAAATPPAARPQAQPPSMPARPVSVSREDASAPMDKFRAIIARRMQESKQQIPHFYVTHAYDVEALLKVREQANANLPEDQRISVNDFIIKVAAVTLRKFPNLNASLNGDQIVTHGHINVGVAVGLDKGLMTVVCRDADLKSIRQISVEMKEMVSRARSGKVKPEDIEGSTFSISNMGMFDVENFSAIINAPEAAILAVSSAMDVPVVKNGEVVVGKQMKITISVDHRVSDGVEAAKFMREMAVYLENPTNLLIEL